MCLIGMRTCVQICVVCTSSGGERVDGWVRYGIRGRVKPFSKYFIHKGHLLENQYGHSMLA